MNAPPGFGALEARFGEWLDPRQAAALAGIPVADLPAARVRAREAGFWIEEEAGRGLRLANAPLRGGVVAGEGGGPRFAVEVVEACDSTNERLLARAEKEPAASGLVLAAESQTAGRGRFGRRWVCPPRKGLLFSALVRLPGGAADGPVLTVAAAVAAARAIRAEAGLPVRIRWPNDLVVGGRKLGGVLAEARPRPGRGPGAVVAGIGLNTHTGSDDFPPGLRGTATSLAAETRRPCDRNALFGRTLRALSRILGAFAGGDLSGLEAEWKELSSVLGSRVRLRRGGEPVEGRVVDLSLEDGIILEHDSGAIGVYAPETVSLVPDGSVE